MHEGGSEPSGADQSPWSVWGIRLFAVLSVALVVSLGWEWIESFYRGVAVSAQLSFRSADQPYMPIHTVAKPILGDHYFGDFQFPLGYAIDLRHSISPYTGSIIADNYPPFSQVLFVLFSFLPLQLSALIYLSLSGAVFLVPLWLMLEPIKREYRIMFLIPVAVLTTPFVTFLDRGNDIGIIAGLITWSLWAWRSERWVLCGSFLAAAIALKAYPATILIVPLGLRRYRFTAIVATAAVIVNVLALAAMPGGYIRNLRALLTALGVKSVPTDQLTSWSLYSIIPKTAGLLFGSSVVHQFLEPRGILIWLPSIVYLGALYFVIRRGRVPQWCWGALSLATVQLIVPLSFVYTTAWAPAAAVWFAWGNLIDSRAEPNRSPGTTRLTTLRIMLLCALTATLTPSVFTLAGSGTFNTALTAYLSPALLLLTLGTALVYSLRSMTYGPESSVMTK